jgi:C-terminal processing protease CtpA/Prc
MKKQILFVSGSLAALGLVLVALPSPPVRAQEPGDPSVALQQKLERQRSSEIARAMLQQLQDMPEQENQRVSVLLGDEGSSWLGVETHEVTAEVAKELKLPAERGVVIGRVTADSPAAKAGLKENDVVTDVNGQRVEGAAQFRREIHEIPAGRAVHLGIWRDGRAQTVSVTLGKAEETGRGWVTTGPGAPGAFAFRMPEVVEIPEMPSFDLNGELALLPGGRARLGIDAEDIGGQLGSYFGAPDGEGILVRGVNPGSPAEKAGVKAGDVITSLNGERIRSVGDLREKLVGKTDEKTVKLGVLRNKSEVTLTVELPPRSPKVTRKIGHRTYI